MKRSELISWLWEPAVWLLFFLTVFWSTGARARLMLICWQNTAWEDLEKMQQLLDSKLNKKQLPSLISTWDGEERGILSSIFFKQFPLGNTSPSQGKMFVSPIFVPLGSTLQDMNESPCFTKHVGSSLKEAMPQFKFSQLHVELWGFFSKLLQNYKGPTSFTWEVYHTH